MNLRKLKKQVQEKHGWWDTVKHKSYRGVPSGWDMEYWLDTKTTNKKFVHAPFYFSSAHHAWREAP